ncbi:MAG TPA: hypothetical protein P5560_13880 [Thermotogota bacterium]|nr:hypothetical protein [Thermotogota bacterium]HRW94038.1 hypothetical protein [Thermotogota bacterium]
MPNEMRQGGSQNQGMDQNIGGEKRGITTGFPSTQAQDPETPTDYDSNENSRQGEELGAHESPPETGETNDEEQEATPTREDSSFSGAVDPFEFPFETDWASRAVSSRSVFLSVFWSSSHLSVLPCGRFFFLPPSLERNSDPKYFKKWAVAQKTQRFLEGYLRGFFPGEPFLEENFLGIVNQEVLLPPGTENERHLFPNLALQFVFPNGMIRVFSLGCLSHLSKPSKLKKGYVAFRKWLGEKPEEKKEFQKKCQKISDVSQLDEFLKTNNFFSAFLKWAMPDYLSLQRVLGSFSPFVELVRFLKSGHPEGRL